jgi:chromosome segregation ATPase
MEKTFKEHLEALVQASNANLNKQHERRREADSLIAVIDALKHFEAAEALLKNLDGEKAAREKQIAAKDAALADVKRQFDEHYSALLKLKKEITEKKAMLAELDGRIADAVAILQRAEKVAASLGHENQKGGKADASNTGTHRSRASQGAENSSHRSWRIDEQGHQ